MRIAVIYSSRTGNTRKVAEAVAEALPEDVRVCRVDDALDPADFELIFVGFWVDKGTADQDARNYMQKLSGQYVGLFATLGAYPDSDHAGQCIDRAMKLLPSCIILDTFICQGAIDPKLIEWMKMLPAEHSHSPSEAKRKLWREAERHPDDHDLEAARQWARHVLCDAQNAASPKF